MKQALAQIALIVREYDEAIDFYTQGLGFDLLEDTPLSKDKRWVVVSPKGGHGADVLLARASDDTQRQAIGNQSGGRVFLFLTTDDIRRDYQTFLDRGVKFVRKPVKQEYGTVAVFADLYGNLWDLIEPAQGHRLSTAKP